MNHDVNKIYILDINPSDNSYRVSRDLGEYILCTESIDSTAELKIMMRLPHKKRGVPFNYIQIGKGESWGKSWPFTSDAIQKTEDDLSYLSFGNAKSSMKFVYIAYADTGDLKCFDARYNKSEHGSKYFCTHCLIDCPEIQVEHEVPYRTPHTFAEGIQKYEDAIEKRVRLPSGVSAIKYSKGVKGFAPEPYPAASRVVPALLHVQMGLMSRIAELDMDFMTNIASEEYFNSILNAINAEMTPMYEQLKTAEGNRDHWKQQRDAFDNRHYGRRQSLTLEQIQHNLQNAETEFRKIRKEYLELQTSYHSVKRDRDLLRGNNALSVYKDKLNEFNIVKTRYFKNLEGMAARKYRKNWSQIMAHCSSSSYVSMMKSYIDTLDSLVKIIGKSKSTVTDEECKKSKELLLKLDEQWTVLRKCKYVTRNMPPKYHYLKESVAFTCFWKMPLGYCNEQSVEAFHQICNRLRRSYLNQRGALRVKYMMERLLIITSPKLCDQYEHAVDDET